MKEEKFFQYSVRIPECRNVLRNHREFAPAKMLGVRVENETSLYKI